jgi:hypothetical protein
LGSLERRLARLEERFRVWHGPEEGQERRRLVEKALQRLSGIELAVLCEVLELKTAHPEAGGVEHWRLMTDTQREMESEWRRVVREVKSELEAPA